MRTALLLSLLLAASTLAFLPAADASPPCPPEDYGCPPPPHPLPVPDCRKVPDKPPLVEVTQDCKVLVVLDLFSCPFGESETSTTHGPVTVTHDACTPCGGACPPPAGASGSAMAPPCQTLTACCPLSFAPCCTLPSCLPPLYRCPDLDVDTTDYVLLLGPSAGAETDHDCSANACLNDPDCSDASCAAGGQPCCSLSGTRSYCTTLAVAAMADPFPTCIRECSPVPNEGCELQEATPTTLGPTMLPFNPRQAVWGGDCDVDVDPIGACAPPSGDTKELRLLFLHVTLLLCGGDLPDWS